MNYKILIYNQTGFNTCNVPESARWVINNLTPYREYDNFELVQGRYLSTLRIELTPSEANKIDFVIAYNDIIYDNTCYVVNGYTMVAPNVCELQLLLEPYSTLGGFGADSGNLILGGTAKRCHISTTDDMTNFYVLDEPFQNREPIEWTTTRLSPISGYIRLIEVIAIPPLLLKEDAIVKAKEKGVNLQFMIDTKCTRNGSISTPLVGYDTNNADAYTIQYMETCEARNLVSTKYIADGTNEIELGARWLPTNNMNYDETISKVVDGTITNVNVKGSIVGDLVSAGMSSNITDLWEIPTIFYSGTSTHLNYTPLQEENCGGFDTITSKIVKANIGLTKWTATTYNNKINYSQALMIKIYNPSSSSTLEHKVYEVIPPNTIPQFITSIPTTLKADIRPSGCPIFMFDYINTTNNVDNMIEILMGGNWRKLGLTDTGTQTLQDLQAQKHREELYDFDTETNSLKQITSFIGDLGNIFGSFASGNIGGAISGIGGIATSQIEQTRNQWRNNITNRQQNEILSLKGATASVNINSASCNYATDIDKNGFYAIVSHFSNNDLISFDTFLTQYGYNVGSMPITNEVFFNRPAYNFVQINDMQVESTTGNKQLIDDTIEKLKQGLRIWHKKPNVNDMLASGNR